MLNHILLFLTLGVSAPAPMDEAVTLFEEGRVQYDSADYNGAIDKFTKALAIVNSNDGNDRTRLKLLFNIATAHEKAFTIDKDVQHLRQALDLYKRYRKFAESTGDLGEELTVDSRITKLEKQLRMHSEIESNVARADEPLPPPPTTPTDTVDASAWTRPRNLGIGFVAGGGVFTVTGIVLAVSGSKLEAGAQAQVDELAELGIPADHPAWEEGAQFVASERNRGAIFTGAGATLAIVGVAGIGVGAYYLVKSKRVRISARPSLSPRFAGIRVSGRF